MAVTSCTNTNPQTKVVDSEGEVFSKDLPSSNRGNHASSLFESYAVEYVDSCGKTQTWDYFPASPTKSVRDQQIQEVAERKGKGKKDELVWITRFGGGWMRQADFDNFRGAQAETKKVATALARQGDPTKAGGTSVFSKLDSTIPLPPNQRLTIPVDPKSISENDRNSTLTLAKEGLKLLNEGRFLEALKKLLAANEKYPGNPVILSRIATCYEKLGRTNDAINVYQAVVNQISDTEPATWKKARQEARVRLDYLLALQDRN